MTDEKPKPRPWFQLRLSTCVVLMVVAGGLGWANIQPNRVGTLAYLSDDTGRESAGSLVAVELKGYATTPKCIVYRIEKNDRGEWKEVEVQVRNGDPFYLTGCSVSVGWPYSINHFSKGFSENLGPLSIEEVAAYLRGKMMAGEWLVWGCVLNGSVALVFLLLTAIACEYLIRRRERRRATTEPAP